MDDLDRLTNVIADAARRALRELFTSYPDHRFHYITLSTAGGMVRPVLSACSAESLAQQLADQGLAPDAEDAVALKWSYADSPFYAFGDTHFEGVAAAFAVRPEPGNDDAYEAEITLRRTATEHALALLDAEGLFGLADDRAQLAVLAEIQPPDDTNVPIAQRLNSTEALAAWLEEAAETPGPLV